MKEKNKLYDMYGNEMVDKSMPNMKQIEEKPTNISIECTYGNHYVSEVLRIIDVYDMFEGIINVKGNICYDCVNGFKPNKMIAFIDKDGKRYSPEIVRQTIPINEKGWLMDSTKDRIDEIDRYRKRMKRYIEWLRISGTLAYYRPKKVRVGNTTIIHQDNDDWWKMVDKVMNNE